MTPPLDALLADLAAWSPPDPEQARLRTAYRDRLLAAGPAALRRDGGPEHVTASALVLDPDLERTVLCLHRKGRFWVQPGGHLEPDDADVAAAALREAREETGLTGPMALPGLLDLNRHALPAGFGACRVHWDVGVAVTAPADAVPAVSDESHAVAWFALDALPQPLAGSVATRLQRARALLAGRSGAGRSAGSRATGDGGGT
ncbi:NUDIX domain-containing protein [Microlunatus capsulatus]|uniref:8-oxo-dGTP pyrophosphatase MutT (NUDIX family) n=1 Tax=Microlunatus capsulatus TaxID=99117 RepID=A0ABS4Z642_9ACTN|nr:NUDIX domain-containing protein [Microlunatus capsulatus]MBP2416522.1 8-oxo-dGTP pyrophosphatase MutT (NUDIX family) [Microlunatus capsulatus]